MPGSPAFFRQRSPSSYPALPRSILSPAIAFDPCYNLWVNFGSGDRVRSRTNPNSGDFMAIRDGTTVVGGVNVQKTDILATDLVPLTWVEVRQPTPGA